MDGDGHFTQIYTAATFGQENDLPVVGGFNGNGVDEIGVYHDGTWIIDANGNLEIDARDKVFKLGGPEDVLVVGDWNGDGADDVGVYEQVATNVAVVSQ